MSRLLTLKSKLIFPLLFVALFIAGCGPSNTPSADTKFHLKSMALAYSTSVVMNDRAPANPDELKKFLVITGFPESTRQEEEKGFQKILDGTYIVRWNLPGYSRSSEPDPKTLVAYESACKDKGGFAVYANLNVKRITPDELKQELAR